MKVLYFHQYFSTPNLKGPSGIRSYAMSKKLISRGHKVTMVCGSSGHTGLKGPYNKGKRRGMVEGIDVIEIDIPYSNHFSFPRRALSFLRFSIRSIAIALKENYDLVFATSTPLTAGIPGIFAKIFRRKKFIFEIRDLWPELPIAMGVIRNPLIISLLRFLEKLIYFSSDAIICLAPGMLKVLKDKEKLKISMAMIPNGCDLDIFDIEKKVSYENLEKNKFYAIFSGSHGLANGLDKVLDAAKELIELGESEIRIILIGEGKLKPHLQYRCDQESIDNVIFMDPIAKHELAKLHKNVHVGLQILSNVESFYFGTSPNKFFDYLASGLPVICNYPGWVTDLIEENQCGLFSDPSKPEDLALKLIELKRDKFRLENYGKNSLKLARTSFNREDLSEKWCRFIEDSCL